MTRLPSRASVPIQQAPRYHSRASHLCILGTEFSPLRNDCTHNEGTEAVVVYLAEGQSYEEHQNRTRPPALWRRWVRSSSTSSTGSRTSFSTPSAMTPSTCPRLYVAPPAEASATQQNILEKDLLLCATACEARNTDPARLSLVRSLPESRRSSRTSSVGTFCLEAAVS